MIGLPKLSVVARVAQPIVGVYTWAPSVQLGALKVVLLPRLSVVGNMTHPVTGVEVPAGIEEEVEAPAEQPGPCERVRGFPALSVVV